MKILWLLLMLWSCGGSPELVDKDNRRDKSKLISLNKIYSDSVTWEGEDFSDWKIFHVDKAGLLFVTVAFDTPDGACEVILRDKYGAHMAREVQSNNPKIVLTRRVEPGRFFVWVHAPGEYCSSGYSVQARIDPDREQPPG